MFATAARNQTRRGPSRSQERSQSCVTVFSAIPLLLGQGSISLAAGALSAYIPDATTNPYVIIATSTGGILLIGLGLNLLEVTRIRIAALLPALLFAPILLWVALQFA
jgi:uncharacterized membrane protein YqgA involved in biofilm formation